MIVVTGGAGFIGSHLVTALHQRGRSEIHVVDRLGRSGKWRNLANAEIAGLLPPERLFSLLDAHAGEIEMVFHLGAVSSTTEADVDLIAASNIAPSLALFDWCARHRTRLIYASSAATYGDGRSGFDDDQSSAALARLTPLNAYAWSKHVVDRRVARLVETGRPLPPQWAGLKFFNVYGAREDHKGEQRSVVAKMLPLVAAGQPARLFRSTRADYADGEQKRDFVWVGDCVAAMLWLADHAEVSGLFNVGSGEARSFNDLARAVFAATDRPVAIEYVDPPESLSGAYQYFTRGSMSKLRSVGYDHPSTPLERGVALTARDAQLSRRAP